MSQSLAKWPWSRPTFRLAFTSQNNIHFIVCLLGLHGTFWLLAGILFVIIPFIYLYVPEAKDVDLNNIDEFFKPVETKFYVEFPLNESGLPGSLESSHRIQMIQNSFGTTGTLLNDGTRQLFAEGFLIKRNGERSKRRHFFLFNDTLVWGSVIKENINYIRQRIIRLNGLEIENIKQSNCWKVVTSGILNSVFFWRLKWNILQTDPLSWRPAVKRRSSNGCFWSTSPSPGLRTIQLQRRRREDLQKGKLTFSSLPRRRSHKNQIRQLTTFLSTWKMGNHLNLVTSNISNRREAFKKWFIWNNAKTHKNIFEYLNFQEQYWLFLWLTLDILKKRS